MPGWFRATTMARMRRYAERASYTILVITDEDGNDLPPGEFRLGPMKEFRDNPDWWSPRSAPGSTRVEGHHIWVGTWTDENSEPAYPIPRKGRFDWKGLRYQIEGDPEELPELAFVRKKAIPVGVASV